MLASERISLSASQNCVTNTISCWKEAGVLRTSLWSDLCPILPSVGNHMRAWVSTVKLQLLLNSDIFPCTLPWSCIITLLLRTYVSKKEPQFPKAQGTYLKSWLASALFQITKPWDKVIAPPNYRRSRESWSFHLFFFILSCPHQWLIVEDY